MKDASITIEPSIFCSARIGEPAATLPTIGILLKISFFSRQLPEHPSFGIVEIPLLALLEIAR